MKKQFLLLTTIAVLFLTACNSTSLKSVYNKDTYEKDLVKLTETKQLQEEESQLISNYILIKLKDEKALTSKSYADLLSDAKKYIADQKEKEEKAKRESLSKMMTVSF